MLKDEVLKQYKEDVNCLRKCAKELKYTDQQISQMFLECLKQLDGENRSSTKTGKCISTTLKIFVLITLILLGIYILLNVHQTTSSVVLRNVQGLIYPGLKVLRFMSVPIIKLFPSLTNMYDESCLIENPYFYVSDMECWPCENVHSVVNLTDFDNHSVYESGVPYILKIYKEEVVFERLRELYFASKEMFDTEANNVKSSNSSVNNLKTLFVENVEPYAHTSWRINKMNPARLIRTVFPRPYIISEWSGQSIERFVMIDGPKSELYTLPNTECSYVFVIQGSGERTIILKPSKECSELCRTVSIVLKPSYALSYNWWYWRPISLPTENSTQTSVSYVTSYC